MEGERAARRDAVPGGRRVTFYVRPEHLAILDARVRVGDESASAALRALIEEAARWDPVIRHLRARRAVAAETFGDDLALAIESAKAQDPGA